MNPSQLTSLRRHAQVLKNLAAQSHLSIRTEVMPSFSYTATHKMNIYAYFFIAFASCPF